MPDIEKPLSYLAWIRSTDITNIPNAQLFQVYNVYLVGWYNEKKKESVNFNEFRSDLFRDLLTEIAINYSTEEERQFLSKIDLTNNHELDLIIPFFVKRLKEISKYLITKRQQIHTIKQKHNIKGSELGATGNLKDKVLTPLSDRNFTDKYPTSKIPSVSSITDYVYIELEPLIDEFDSYFDINPDIDINRYVTNDPQFVSLFKSNVESIDKNLWLDLTTAVTELITREVPVVMELNPSLSATTVAQTNEFNELELNYARTDIETLPESQFVNQLKNEDDLNILYEKKLIEKYGGSKMLYLSTGSTATNYVSGVLFDPENKSANYLNRYNSAHPSVPSILFLKTEKDIGKFFGPQKQGILNFERLDTHINLDKTKLTANTTYVYPDIEQYETGRGSSLVDTPLIYKHIDNNTAVKGSKSNAYIEGEIINDSKVQKLYPYQSVEETQQLQNLGISRWSDNVDFWEGEKKDIWANNDIYKKLPLQDFPVRDKQNDLLVGDKNLVQWKTDIYGNEYALFKVIKPTRKTTEQAAGIYTKTSIQDATDTENVVISGAFDYPTPAFFNYQLDGSVTKYESTFNSLTADKTIHERNNLESTQMYFRNSRSTIISPASSALSAVFIKYDQTASIKSEIENNIVSFDVVGNIIVLQTKNHLILEKYDYDIDTDTFTSVLPFKAIVSIDDTSSPIEKLASYWYDERFENFYLGKTVLHPYLSGSNYKAIYPEIYVYNDANGTFTNSFGLDTMRPAISSLSYVHTHVQEAYNLLLSNGFVIHTPYSHVGVTSGTTVNITTVDAPIINVNSLEYTMVFNCIGVDVSDIQYIFNYYFDVRDYKRLKIKQLDLYAPNMNVFNYNLSHYADVIMSNGRQLSAHIESLEINRGGMDMLPITIERFKSKVEVSVPGELVIYPMVFGTTAVSGRDTNPAGVKDLTNGTVRLGAGLRATSSDPSRADAGGNPNSVEVAGTDILPYSHNTSFLLLNAPLSGVGRELVVSFDVALYTNTTENSAYAQITP